MDITAAYLIMILTPFTFLITKLSIHYECYEYLRKNHSKSYIRKNKGKFIQSFFMITFRKELNNFYYYVNFLYGIFLVTSLVLAITYLVLWIFGYELRFLEIPYFAAIVNHIVWFIHMLNIIRNKLLGK